MTRDEAIEIVKLRLQLQNNPGVPTEMVQTLIELDLLKVDEPESLRDKFRRAIIFKGNRKCEEVDAIMNVYDEAHK